MDDLRVGTEHDRQPEEVLANVLPAQKFGSKVVDFKAKPFEKTL